MELLLNLVWALATALMLLSWSFAGCRTTRTWRSVAGVLTLACVSLLLFPVISMTDDLNPSMVYAEDANATKRIARSASLDHQHIAPDGMPAILSAGPHLPLPQFFESLAADLRAHHQPSISSSRTSDRAPPLLFA